MTVIEISGKASGIFGCHEVAWNSCALCLFSSLTVVYIDGNI